MKASKLKKDKFGKTSGKLYPAMEEKTADKPVKEFVDYDRYKGSEGKMNTQIKKIISEIINRLKNRYRPEKVILFGSFAGGRPKEGSDIDLLIIKETKKEKIDRFVEVKKVIYDPERNIPVSPIVMTEKELNNRIELGDDFIKEIVKKGILIYER